MNEIETFEETEDDQEFAELGQLQASAPVDVIPRLQKRVRTAQLGKDLIEKQAIGFWAVIDAFLKLLFAPKKVNENNKKIQEKNNAGNIRNS